MPNKPATNGEYYDHERQQWFVMCGPDSVPFRKQDTAGNEIRPPARENVNLVDSSKQEKQ